MLKSYYVLLRPQAFCLERYSLLFIVYLNVINFNYDLHPEHSQILQQLPLKTYSPIIHTIIYGHYPHLLGIVLEGCRLMENIHFLNLKLINKLIIYYLKKKFESLKNCFGVANLDLRGAG